VLVRTGRPLVATRLLAAATQMHEVVYPGSLQEQPANYMEWERSVALARAALGASAFDAAWAEGEALAPEQAIAEAWRHTARSAPLDDPPT